jgi:hypothetical protein
MQISATQVAGALQVQVPPQPSPAHVVPVQFGTHGGSGGGGGDTGGGEGEGALPFLFFFFLRLAPASSAPNETRNAVSAAQTTPRNAARRGVTVEKPRTKPSKQTSSKAIAPEC